MGDHDFAIPSEPVQFDQNGCVYTPHVFGIQVGQTFQILNSDPLMHNLHALAEENRPFNFGMPNQGDKREQAFRVPEVMLHIKCDVHPWMAAFISVFEHPYFAISGADGSFTIPNLPPGDYVDYRLLQRLPDVPAIDAMSSRIARSYRDVALPAAMEPRLRDALDVMGERQVVFGYFRGSLYLAGFAKSSESGWYNLNQLARRVGGHLATVSSAEENSFIHDLFSRDQRFVTSDASGSRHGPMIGLYQPPGSAEPGGGWAWVTGEPLAYTNWSPGNPDNYLGGQGYAGFFRPPKPPRGDPRVIWWDDNTGSHNRFVIEIE